MRRTRLLPLLAAMALLAACSDVRQPTAPVTAPSASRLTAGTGITVMTRNMYLGANIDPLLAPGADPRVVLPAALAQLQYTDFPARAQHLAEEIASHLPDAVGLQEVSHYRFDLANGGVAQMDFLDILRDYLAAMGAPYDVAVRQNNLSLPIPLGGAGGYNVVTYTDGDAILVRHGVSWSDPAAGHYPTQAQLDIAGTPITNFRGWNAVTVEVGGFTFRFVNTHLEIQLFRAIQEQQATELASMLHAETLPVVLVGDFNSAANPSAPADAKTASYSILRGAGFADIELREPHSATMLTCCNAADLSNATPTYDQRLDLVLVHLGKAPFGGQSSIELTGTRFLDPHGYYLWPSDHAGVVAQIWPAPGLLARP